MNLKEFNQKIKRFLVLWVLREGWYPKWEIVTAINEQADIYICFTPPEIQRIIDGLCADKFVSKSAPNYYRISYAGEEYRNKLASELSPIINKTIELVKAAIENVKPYDDTND